MSWGGPEFVIAIIALSMAGWVVNTWIRARHGYPLEDEWFGMTEKSEKVDTAETERLRDQNQQLRNIVERMEDRMVVLERIVTDKGYTVAEEIEALRDKPARRADDAGVPLNIKDREQV
ncbi:hypothetical protein OZN62_05290 [Aurantiacibacter sp. MUD11]|uniref:hypothetical protein n=1 Tax=Aurantiacibacter sp. MUD11 TaxID=3003265 RepID=UPI0022AB018B|nr:hypothetical protein [Aurantiacibacter sp. MUD11]WAT18983.1 hypothetical protein OZN62_05290 [Aurantiacibacter sp. MUD11]